MHANQSERVRLNIGCGEDLLPDYVNVDKFGNPDVRVDLQIFPWPWEDNSVDEIYSRGCYEHLPEFMRSWNESWRILKPGGKITLIVPHFASPLEPWPEQHIHHFSLHTFNYSLMYKHQYCAGIGKFKTIKLRHWFGPRLKFMEPIANIAPVVWEWLKLPTAEIEWSGVKVID